MNPNSVTNHANKPAKPSKQKPAPAKPALPLIDEEKQRAEWEGKGPPLEDPETIEETADGPPTDRLPEPKL